MTNADWIKNMSIDELAGCVMCPYDITSDPALRKCDTFGHPREDEGCIKCCKAWLEREYEDGTT